MYRVELSVATHRVRLVYEDADGSTITGFWSDDVSLFRDWRDKLSAGGGNLVEALNEAITILGAYDSQGVRTRVSNRGVRGMGRGVVDMHHLSDRYDFFHTRSDF